MTATAYLLTGGGLALLYFGGEFLLRGAVSVALRSNLPPLLIGLTIVACATSMPELLVTVTAGLEGVSDVGVGNVIGSNIANILLILGVGAVLKPIEINPKMGLRDLVVMLLATGVFIFFAIMGEFGRLHSAGMLLGLGLYIWFSYKRDSAGSKEIQEEVLEDVGEKPCSFPMAFLLLALGLGALIAGSEMLIDGAVSLARAAGISETVIGLTLVAIGTSLPELATAVVAGLRGHTDVALGNVIGSNIFNILLIIGALGLIVPFTVAEEVIAFDIWAMAGASLLLVPFILLGRAIGRGTGFGFLAIYAIFVALQFINGGLKV